MRQQQTKSQPNLLNNTVSSNQLIRFPTITKLMYDGDNSQQIKNSFKSTNTKLMAKNTMSQFPVPVGKLAQTNSFRLVEVPPDDYIMKICTMNINDPGPKQRVSPEHIENLTSRNSLGALKKQKSSTNLTNISNPLNRRVSLATINRTTQTPVPDKLDQQSRNPSRTHSLLKPKLKIDFKLFQSKININEIYNQVINALALVNGKVIITQGKNYQRIRRAKIDKGNNGFLVKQMIKKRIWWNTTDQLHDSNMIWTQKTIKNIQVNNSFYAYFSKEQQSNLAFQRNIDRILSNYPKILQLFFTDQEILKHSNQSSKFKRMSELYNMLGSIKATRKVFPENIILYNHIPNNFQICSKKMLYKNLWMYFHENGKNPYTYLPKTYHLTAFDWQQKIEFVKSEQKSIKSQGKEQEAWFIKPGENTNRGRGIQIFKSTSEALDYIVRNPPKSLTKTYILQKYINPLLYNSRKFDIRCYMLCIQIFQTQVFYWYEEGYIRTSSQKFTMNKTSISIHLTNDAIQKELQNYDKYETANKLSYGDIDKYIKNQYGFEFFNDILKKMKSICTDVCKAAVEMGFEPHEQPNQEETENEVRPNLQSKPQNQGLYFQVFGLDFIISNEGEPFLLEVNTNPCYEINSNLLSRVIPEMIENTFRIVTDVYLPNRSTGANSCPDWSQNFLQNNKYSLLYRRQLNRSSENVPSNEEKKVEKNKSN